LKTKIKLAMRRKLVMTTVCLVALVSVSALGADMSNLRLENDHYLVEARPPNGVIARICDKERGLELLQEPRLADNFKFSLPIRREFAWQSTEANYILGRDQRLTSHRQTAARLNLTWGGPLMSVLGKRHPVSATMTIELAGADLRFGFTIRNASNLEIGEVYYPILGGSLGLGATPEVRRQTELVLPGLLEVRTANIFHTFANMSWLGVLGPEQYYTYPDHLSMSWMQFHNPRLNRSVYFGAHDPVVRYKAVQLEMSPGVSGPRAEGNWPRPEELNGVAAGVKFCFVQFPYRPAGQAFEATPVVLRCHDGDWHEAARTYGAWLSAQNDLSRPRSEWLWREPAFQQCEAVPFKDLPRWAKPAAEAGVRSLLLAHWSPGGTDNPILRFDPDPRLGTREEFAEAIRQCHALGVKVAVVMNLPPASQLTEAYRTEFHRYACEDRWGIPYTSLGASEASPLTGGFGAGERRVWLNPGHPGLRRALLGQMRALAELGVDGVHFQDFFARPLDFNPTVGRTPDRASWEGGLDCLREIREACRAIQPELAISTDAVWDRPLSLSQVCSAEARDRCALRTAFPFWQPTFTVADDDAYAAINSALRYRARLRVASADGQPLGGAATAAITGYLRAVLAAREILSHTLLEGELAETNTVRIAGTSKWSVFRNPASGLRTAVLVNPRAETLLIEFAGFAPSATKPVRLWLPTHGTTNLAALAQFEIPGRHLALLTEEDAANRLPVMARSAIPAPNEHVVFDLASSEDLEGWTLTGGFSVSSMPGLIPKPTLNSVALAGETATGIALSPPFTVEPQFDHLEALLQGGWSEKSSGRENLVLRIVDATTGATLEELLPPGIHELRTQRLQLDKLKGRTVRLQLVDENRNSSYAWIGLRKLVLHGSPTAAIAK
jgi:hypothetical protein